MGEPGQERENPPSELWGRWRSRRAARAAARAGASDKPPADPHPAGRPASGPDRPAAGALPEEPPEAPRDWAWSAAGTSTDSRHECLDWCPICRAADIVRAGFGPELQAPLRDIQREGLSILRSAIDLYLQHLEDEPPPSPAGEAPAGNGPGEPL